MMKSASSFANPHSGCVSVTWRLPTTPRRAHHPLVHPRQSLSGRRRGRSWSQHPLLVSASSHPCPTPLSQQPCPAQPDETKMTATTNKSSATTPQQHPPQQANSPLPAASSPPSLAPTNSSTALMNKDYTQYWYTPVYTGLLGAGMGTAAGAWRGHSALLLALHLGIGYGVFGATFSSTLYGLERLRGQEGTMNWVGAGAAAGAVTSLITAGPKQMVRGAVFFGGVGLVAESMCDIIGTSITEYKDKRAKQRFGQPTTPPAWGGNKGLEK